MPSQANSEPALRARLIAAWPVWAGGYPTPSEALEVVNRLADVLHAEIEQFLGSLPGCDLALHDVRVYPGTYQPIKGLTPRTSLANSLEFLLEVNTLSCTAEAKADLGRVLPDVAKNISSLVRKFCKTHMPGALKGANIYDIETFWDPGPAIPILGAAEQSKLNPKHSGERSGKASPQARAKSVDVSFANAIASSRPGPYVILRPRLINQVLNLEYEDSRGNKRGIEPGKWMAYSVSPVGTPGWPGIPAVCAPTDLDSLLADMTAGVGDSRIGHDDPEVLPVFVGSEPLLPTLPFVILVERLPPVFSRWTQIQIVRLARQTWKPRTPFELPLRVRATTVPLNSALEVMRSRQWFSGNAVVQKFGLVLAPPVRPGQGIAGQDLLICGTKALGAILSDVEQTSLNNRPRLLLAIGEMPLVLPAPIPDGISLLLIPPKSRPSDLGEFLKTFLYALIHDSSLPAALKAATSRAGSELIAPACLFSDPFSIHDLLFRDAMMVLLHEALDLHAAPSLVVSPSAATETKNTLANFGGARSAALLLPAVKQALGLMADFSEERKGLLPIAHARKALDQARRARQKLDSDLAPLTQNPSMKQVLEENQQRRVDITLLRDESDFELRPFVQPGEKLIISSRYFLRVQVGRRSPASLIQEDIPHLDVILPDTNPAEGHYLNIVLFPQDFVSHSSAMCRVFLPRFGNSEAAVFSIAAPKSPGLARLRVGVYYDLPGNSESLEAGPDDRNHLLQLFLLEASVGRGGEILGDGEVGLSVKLEFSRTTRFTNFRQLTERRLSIAINDDPQGSHRLLVKGAKAHQDLQWSETAGTNALKSMRELLKHVTWNDGGNGPRFPENPPSKPEAEFDKCIQKLAVAGKELYDDLWVQASNDFQDVLVKLRESSDRVIQIIRLATNFLFPWASLYDFDVPSDKAGTGSVEICKGFTRDGYDCEKCLGNCLCPDKTQTYCVYGFWGTRHKVEQLLHTPFQREDAITEIKPAHQKAVHISLGVKGDIVDNIISDLRSTLGKDAVHDLHSLKEMLERLWSQGERPAILLVLGHYETPAPTKPRITFVGNEWFEPRDITHKVQKLRKWKDFNPVVVLAACESAAGSMDSITNFLTAFADARAAAVIGTETTVFEGLACRFAKEISAALLKAPGATTSPAEQCLGQAVVDFRRRLLKDFNPLGLVFTPYGDAGLHSA